MAQSLTQTRAQVSAVPWSEWLLELLFPSRCACLWPAWARSSAPAAGAGSSGSARRSARAAARRPRGRSTAAASARAAGSRSRRRAPRSPTRGAARPFAAGVEGARPPPARRRGRRARRRASCPGPAADVITYIPPDGDRSLRRGHHPARALAGELGARWELDVAPAARRARGRSAGRPGSAAAERRRNVRGAFAATAGSVPAAVVLVDDVYTTGATVGAAARRPAGGRRDARPRRHLRTDSR